MVGEGQERGEGANMTRPSLPMRRDVRGEGGWEGGGGEGRGKEEEEEGGGG